jgi:hypothetical protein
MRPIRVAAMVLIVLAAPACNSERLQECARLTAAIQPIYEGTPSAATVDRVSGEVSAMKFQDQPLGIYAENYRQSLTVLGNTLRLRDGPSPPDGTDDVIKEKLKQARTDREDIRRYCQP